MRKLFLIISIFIILIIAPLYAASRIIVPNWLVGQFENSIPDGHEISVGNAYSTLDFTIIYENITYSTAEANLEIPELVLSPRLSFYAPIALAAKQVKFRYLANSFSFGDLELKILPTDIKFNDVVFEGSVGLMSDAEALIIKETNFLISRLTGSSIELELTGETAKLLFDVEGGAIYSQLDNFESSLSISDSLSVTVKSNEFRGGYKIKDASNDNGMISGEELILNLKLTKSGNWTVPFDIAVKDMSSNAVPTLGNLNLKARGEWDDTSSTCNLKQLLSSSELCGKMIHVRNIETRLLANAGNIFFTGDGYCVAPRSGCGQKIFAKVSSKNTVEVFSSLISSGILDPFVGGVLMGALLGSPKGDDTELDHEVNVDVSGSQILVNGEPLLK